MLSLIHLFFFGCESQQLSVIIPVYNSASSISRCLASVLNQDLRDIEVICVDDGSLDKSLKILKNIAKNDERVTVLHQKNCGPSCARNAGLALAHGTYVGFVDSDDWIESDLFRCVFKEAKDNDVDVVEFGYLCGNKIVMPPAFRLPEKAGKISIKIFRGIDAAKYLLPKHTFNMNWSKIYRKSLIKDNGILFDKLIHVGEDLLFNIDLIPFVDSVLCIRRVFYHYHWIKKNEPVIQFHKHCRLLANGLRRHMEKIKKNNNYKNQISEKNLKDIKKEITKYWKMSERKKKNRKKFTKQNRSSKTK